MHVSNNRIKLFHELEPTTILTYVAHPYDFAKHH